MNSKSVSDMLREVATVSPLFFKEVRPQSPSLVAGAWTEREKIFHGGSFFKLADDNKYIKNPEAQNRALRGF